MRWLLVLLFSLPMLAGATNYQVITFTAPADYTLSLTAVKLFCNALYSQLSAEALNKIERLMATPYSCQLGSDSKSLIITFTLKNS